MVVEFRHERNMTQGSGDKKNTVKEMILDGDEGLSFRYLTKDAKNFHMISGKETEPGKFLVRNKKDEKEDEKTVDEKELTAMIKSIKGLAFLADYMKDRKKMFKQKGGAISYMTGGAKKPNKKANKKASKKASKKSSEKASKKASKKSSKKASKKASKKSSKKTGAKKGKKTTSK